MVAVTICIGCSPETFALRAKLARADNVKETAKLQLVKKHAFKVPTVF